MGRSLGGTNAMNTFQQKLLARRARIAGQSTDRATLEASVRANPLLDPVLAVNLVLDQARTNFLGCRAERTRQGARVEIWGPNEARLARWLLARAGMPTIAQTKPGDDYITILEVVL
jgi:hypothetical protein